MLIFNYIKKLFKSKKSEFPSTLFNDKAKELSQSNLELNSDNKLLIEREIELEKANKQLQQTDAVRSEVVSIVAHQLRTPLVGIKWSLSLIVNGDMGPLTPEQKTFLDNISDSNERMIRFVNDLLSISRLESGHLEYNFEAVNLQHVVDSVLLDINPLANKKEISIGFQGRGVNLPAVKADADKIRVVFQNILENAVKYTKVKGHIKIEIRNRGNDVIILIEDDGIGIPKEEQKEIFNRFYRAPNALKIEVEGSGLGLYLSKAIVLGHSGKIWFESEKNRGTKFYFTIPISQKMVSN